MKKQLLVYGAGAIGRGYVPWVFHPDAYDLVFVEANTDLLSRLSAQGRFTTFRTREGRYERLDVPIHAAVAPGEEAAFFETCDGVVTAVGPRQVLDLKDTFAQIPAPILLFENDDALAAQLRQLSGKSDIYFGVPDVITSNTAPEALLAEDPLAIVTEDGVCFADDRASVLGGEIDYVSEHALWEQWMAKLYIHNTPHCIAAYLGALQGRNYLHEGMQDPAVYAIVEGAMMEMRNMVIEMHGLDPQFVDWYADKELKRFANVQLYDPIIRVAREPFRKLGLDNRLIGAAQLALTVGIVPQHIIKGILAAFLYNKKNDPDFNIQYLVNALTPDQFLKLIINLSPHEALYKLLLKHWEATVAQLKGLVTS